MSVFNLGPKNHLTSKMFFDENGGVDIARYDTLKYPDIDVLTEKQIGFFWRPQEIDLNQDKIDFSKLTDHEKHIFTSNLKRQILLDSVQGRAPSQVFTPIIGLPEMENWVGAWTFFELIHSRSYTHIIRQVYANPTIVFDNLKDISEIVDCAKDISASYDDFHQASLYYQLLGVGTHTINGKKVVVDLYDLKKKLWLCINSVNILEGIRFYVSFACSWAFAENKQMEGNAKLIKFIARDENLHLASTQKLLRHILVEDDPVFAQIKDECHDEVMAMFKSAMEQEKAWAKYLFKDGSMIGLNEHVLCEYVDYIASQRMKAIGLTPDFKAPSRDPLPWTASWISSKTRQVAPQETEVEQYINGGVKQDAGANDFGGFSL